MDDVAPIEVWVLQTVKLVAVFVFADARYRGRTMLAAEVIDLHDAERSTDAIRDGSITIDVFHAAVADAHAGSHHEVTHARLPTHETHRSGQRSESRRCRGIFPRC